MAPSNKLSTQKITANLPTSLLKEAIKNTGVGITETLRKALELLNASSFYEEALKNRGKIKFGVSVKSLRDDS